MLCDGCQERLGYQNYDGGCGPAMFGGHTVTLHGSTPADCTHPDGIEVMHHTDVAGRHCCPTTFVWCVMCVGVGDEPEPYSCTRWEATDA